MSSWYLYFLLPLILFPATSVLSVALGRKIGSQKMSLYRQGTIIILGIPLLFWILEKFELLKIHYMNLILCGVFWALYLSTAFYAMNLTSIWISRSFLAVSRTITGFILGYVLFREYISLYDIGGLIIIWLGFYLSFKYKWEHFSIRDIKGILFSLIAGIFFTINTLIFKLYAKDFSPLESAYLLESTSFPFLLIASILIHKWDIKKSFKIDIKKIWVIFLTAPLILLASYGLAESVNRIPFYIFNTLFIFVLVTSVIFSWIFLGEKFTLKQLSAMIIMVLWCGIIVVF